MVGTLAFEKRAMAEDEEEGDTDDASDQIIDLDGINGKKLAVSSLPSSLSLSSSLPYLSLPPLLSLSFSVEYDVFVGVCLSLTHT